MKNINLLAITAFIIFILEFLGLFDALNEIFFEKYLYLNKARTQSSEIVIIEIDEKSLDQIGNWPWKRYIYAKLLDQIKNYPKVIGITIAFTEERNILSDRKLKETLEAIPNVVLISKYTMRDVEGFSLALPEKSLYPLAKQGHDLLVYSKNSVVTAIEPFKKHPAFSLMVLADYFDLSKGDYSHIPARLKPLLENVYSDKSLYTTDEQIFIDYNRTPDQFKKISFADVINNQVDLKQLKDKIVLIGVTDRYIANTYMTPLAHSKGAAGLSTAVELQAQIIDSLLNYRGLVICPRWLIYLISILIIIGFFFLTQEKGLLKQGLYLTNFILLLFIIDFSLYKYAAVWFPPALVLIWLLVGFGISVYALTTRVDTALKQTIEHLKSNKDIPLDDIPTNLSSRVSTLSYLLEIISRDRQSIKRIIDGINNEILVLNSNGEITWANEKICQLLEVDLLKQVNINDVIDEIDFEEIKEEVLESKVYKKEMKIKNKDFVCVINVLQTKETQYVAIFNDISDLKQINRLKTNMVKMVSHEFRTPLNAIIGFSDSLRLQYFGELNEKQQEYIKLINDSGKHLLAVINDILDISKIDENSMEFHPEKTNISEIIKEIVSVMMNEFESKNIKFEYEIDNELTDMNCDRQKFKQIMFNLLSNASKYTNDNGSVSLNVLNLDDKTIKFLVTDTGVGIEESEFDKIFDEYYQLDQVRDQALGGTGIGLALCKRLVRMHNGDIGVESEPQKGSKFWFTIPLNPDKFKP